MSDPAMRCAIYTRKSFEPPIGQEVTSLESQRAICSSYIVSQQHRGWIELSKHYDDSGRTGANTARPALQQMLADVESGLIGVVLVYKLDRLTRTLLDFVRLMDFLERHNVALVSITQNFDTSDSLGRLVLNILLTFAQFEREILSDRMKDKIRVLKQMGRWVGGSPPIGYDVGKGKLHINRREAAGVRLVFETYVEKQSLEAVHRRLKEAGFRRKVWVAKGGGVHGGGPITLSNVHHILRNPIYVGKIRHHKEIYEGIHSPIIDRPLFDRVQQLMAARSAARPRIVSNLLTGLLFDSAGRPMCVKEYEYKDRKIRYYVSNVSAWARRQKLKRMRANGDELEQLVVAAIRTMLQDRERIRHLLLNHGVHGAELDRLTRSGSVVARSFESISQSRVGDLLKSLLQRIELTPEDVVLVIYVEELRRLLGWDGVGVFKPDAAARQRNGAVHIHRVASNAIRANHLFALPITPRPASTSGKPMVPLIELLNDAQRARKWMAEHRDLALPDLAEKFGCKMSRFSRLVRLTYLAPDIELAIRDGVQPPTVTKTALLKANLPLDWATQRTLLGFAAQPEHFRNPSAISPN